MALLRDGAARAVWRWAPEFQPEEFVCKGSGILQVDEGFMDALLLLRKAFFHPMPISSGYRSPEHNQAVSTTGPDGPHTKAAVDVRIAGPEAFLLVVMALERGWLGIGVNQRGAGAGRFIHLDSPPGGPTLAPRPRVWSY